MNKKKVRKISIIASISVIALAILATYIFWPWRRYVRPISYDRVEMTTSFCYAQDEDIQFRPFKTDDRYAIVLPEKWDSTEVLRDADLNSLNIEILRTRLPMVFINTESGTMTNIDNSLDKSVQEKGRIVVVDADGNIIGNKKLDKIHGRGRFSWEKDPKKGYNICLSKKIKIPGLKKGKKFSLISCYIDPAFLRNYITLSTARSLKMPNAVRSAIVQVYLNGHYAGLYQITNKVDISNSSVDITDLEEATEAVNDRKLKKYERFSVVSDSIYKLRTGILANEPQDITGGYLLETGTDGVSSFKINDNTMVALKSPKYATSDQIVYISSRYAEMLDAIYAPDGINPNTGKHYSQYIDVPSFAKYYLLQEVFLNRDGGMVSLYMYKDSDLRDSLFYAGPLWDMISAVANPCLAPYAQIPNIFFVKGRHNYEGKQDKILLAKLLGHEEFSACVDSIYQTFARDIISDYSMGDKYDSICDIIRPELLINNKRWHPNKSITNINHAFKVVKRFMSARIEFFDNVYIYDTPARIVNFDLVQPHYVLEYHLFGDESIEEAPYPFRIRGNLAFDDWYYKGTDTPYDTDSVLEDGAELELRWHNKSLWDELLFFWDKRTLKAQIIPDYD